MFKKEAQLMNQVHITNEIVKIGFINDKWGVLNKICS